MEPVPEFDLFLSYSRRDATVAEALAVRLAREAGLRVWMDRARLEPGASWRDEIERAMNGSAGAVIAWGPNGLGPVQRQERDLAYVLRDARPGFRVVYALLPHTPPPQGTWANVDTWVRFEGGVDEADPFARLVAALRGQAPPGELGADLPDEPAPYRGLAAFGVGDQRFFFGRSAFLEETEARLERYPFLAVVGASGSGKTSLVQAGLLARLEAQGWRSLVMRPGPRPLRSLAGALARLRGGGDPLAATDDLASRLDAAPSSLPDLVQALVPEGERLVLVIDRLEELFTLGESEEELGRFAAAVVTLARHPHRPARLVVTLRADFYARLGRFPELAQEVVGHQVYLTPLRDEEVAEVIEAPAALVGAVFEKGLARQVRDDASQRGEVVLPLLQHALDLLWRKRRGRWLTWEAYEEVGRVEGALRYHADRVVASLSAEEREAARRLLTQLVWIEEDAATGIAGRRVEKEQLVHDEGGSDREERVLERLADERLVQLRGGGGEASVELVHDTLPLHWGQLHDWVREDREFLLWRQRLQAELAEWERTGRDEGTLLRGAPLAEAERWLGGRRGDLAPGEVELIAASVALRERERTARERLRRRIVGGLAAGLVLALGLSLAAVLAWRRAEAERRLSVSRQLALQSREVMDRQPDLGLLLAAEAYRTADTFEARSALAAGLAKAPPLVALLHGPGEADGALAFSPDGRTLVAALTDESRERWYLQRWDVATRQPTGEPLTGPTDRVTRLVFSPDGTTLAAVGSPMFGDETIHLWDLKAGAPAGRQVASLEGLDPRPAGARPPGEHAQVSALLAGIGKPIVGSSSSPQGTTLIAVAQDGEVFVWDLSSPTPARRPGGRLGGEWVSGVSFAPDGRSLVAGNGVTDELRLWSLTDEGESWTFVVGRGRLNEVFWSADGRRLAVPAVTEEGVKKEGELDVLTLDPERGYTRSFPFALENGSAQTVAFSPDGRTLAISDYRGRIFLWDPDERESIHRRLPGGSSTWASAAWSPDGRLLAWGTSGKAVALWDAEARRLLPLLAGHEQEVTALAFSPDGRTLVSGDWGGAIHRWDVDRRAPAGPALAGSVSVVDLAFVPDGRTLVVRRYDESSGAALWDLAAGRQLGELCPGSLSGLAVSPRRPLAACTNGEEIEVVDLESRQRVGKPWALTAPMLSIAFSPDGETLATGDQDVLLWDLASGKPIGRLPADAPSAIVSLSFDRDGTRLAAGTADGPVVVWDLTRRRRFLPPLAGGPGQMTLAALSPDGRRLVTASNLSAPILWDLDVASWPDRACRIANRNLTDEEWQQALGEETPYRKTCPDLPEPAAAAGTDPSAPVPVPEPSEKAMRYYRSGNALWIVSLLWGLLVPAALLFSGSSARLRDLAARLARGRWLGTVAVYVVLLTLLLFLLDLPLSWWIGFARRHAYGLSNQTLGKWLRDALVGLGLGAGVGAATLWLPYLLVRKSPRRWWLWTWLLAIPFVLFTVLVTPVWIDPLFNDFGPMEDEALEARILALAERAGIAESRVFEVDKSVDTKTVNAYVTGLFGTHRIVLWDTLLARLDDREVLAVVGHEMGHYVLGHVWRSIALILALLLGALWLVDRLGRAAIARFRSRFGVGELGDVASLPLAMLLFSLISLAASPAVLAFSRHNEHEADRFALEVTRDNRAAAMAFVELQRANLSNPRPGRLYRFWRSSHPPLGERIEFANRYRPWEHGEPLRYGELLRPRLREP